ncbi:MAG: proton-conducting transporter membrane subunit [Turneriella sp.]
MILKYLTIAFVVYPLVTSFIIAISPWRSERFISRLVLLANTLNGLLSFTLLGIFVESGFRPVEIAAGHLFSIGDYRFDFMFLVDKYSVSFQVLIGILSGLVLMFSGRYMHREAGHARFFASLFLFMSGISLVALAATIDMLFAGWEIVGISSFLLIGFYRMRLQPGRNSLRAYAIYRFCDVGLFLGAWLFHKLGSEYFFLQFADRALDETFVQLNLWFFTTIGLLVVLAAMGKSAQYPFSFWVPRAMEGPTPSSAIFYGALSIHAGVYLLIRMYPLWRAVAFIPWLVGAVGLFTAFSASISQKTQSNIKGQIGYASVAQVGLMFFELALGWREVAMIHFLGNAVLRCYQLLASPSVMVIYLRQQAEGEVPSTGLTGLVARLFNSKMRHWYFAFSFSEGYAEFIILKLWHALKAVAHLLGRLFSPMLMIVLVLALLIVATFGRPYIGEDLNIVCAIALGILAIFMAVAALGQSIDPARVLWMTALSAVLKGLSVVYLAPETALYSLLYFSGITAGFAISRIALHYIPRAVQLTEYAGAADAYTMPTNVFFIGVLWMTGFTLSPTFFGDDVLLHFSAEKFPSETLFIGTAFVINAVTLMRSYVKLAFAR